MYKVLCLKNTSLHSSLLPSRSKEEKKKKKKKRGCAIAVPCGQSAAPNRLTRLLDARQCVPLQVSPLHMHCSSVCQCLYCAILCMIAFRTDRCKKDLGSTPMTSLLGRCCATSL
ncbi:hypothetical protein K450DRAFT_233454 [Umbelopsis ramanniana AG]|uniref:Uncharacterized protein n=1 Tax=Umbelopsis ramanniana AG TaxID=1314678 RepID=A0AAD5HFY0_UMBRA|nr:uncharacterized protein K450DRAFT_233454 [Umbelopsis ramanniana AG]KAI8581176.1 hypothetical protein K450DRAFT_233454 [Umbelopsis ramanniana AG]